MSQLFVYMSTHAYVHTYSQRACECISKGAIQSCEAATAFGIRLYVGQNKQIKKTTTACTGCRMEGFGFSLSAPSGLPLLSIMLIILS